MPRVAAAATVPSHIPALDGLRGLMTVFVMVSHFFGEVPHGTSLFCVGWIAVHMFFVLSGFLVGRLIIRARSAANFLSVFYLRRVLRTFPIYFVCCLGILALLIWLGSASWTASAAPLPTWSYLAFAQNLFVTLRGTAGQPWLAPTWTLALEEQFYLLAPWLFLLAPPRLWVPLLGALCGLGVLGRAAGVLSGLSVGAPLSILPTSADVLSMGLLLAVLLHERRVDWPRWGSAIRAVPIACLFATCLTQHLGAVPAGPAFQILGPLLIAVGCACLLLTLVQGAPEAARFHAPLLRFFGRISYAVYLTHLAVLGLVHGWLFAAQPDVASPAQVAATLAAVPLTIGLAWVLTVTVEQPLTAWGRSFAWR